MLPVEAVEVKLTNVVSVNLTPPVLLLVVISPLVTTLLKAMSPVEVSTLMLPASRLSKEISPVEALRSILPSTSEAYDILPVLDFAVMFLNDTASGVLMKPVLVLISKLS